MESALTYMDLLPGTPVKRSMSTEYSLVLHKSRIEDLREAANIFKGKSVQYRHLCTRFGSGQERGRT
ncbi:MAG: hypothetical protein CM1200mP18_22780 [Gammaproteobacteria bacterium]|nr:MAG: hypothetical protein CM1200mP18_22780 [Gammaproteobacteria bacterium]